jgi:hypothetical protein
MEELARLPLALNQQSLQILDFSLKSSSSFAFVTPTDLVVNDPGPMVKIVWNDAVSCTPFSSCQSLPAPACDGGGWELAWQEG